MQRSYPNIHKVSNQFLELCKENGVMDRKVGIIVLAQIEEHLSGIDIKNDDFAKAINSWKNGRFCYGYHVNTNDTEFVNYIKNKMSYRFI